LLLLTHHPVSSPVALLPQREGVRQSLHHAGRLGEETRRGARVGQVCRAGPPLVCSGEMRSGAERPRQRCGTARRSAAASGSPRQSAAWCRGRMRHGAASLRALRERTAGARGGAVRWREGVAQEPFSPETQAQLRPPGRKQRLTPSVLPPSAVHRPEEDVKDSAPAGRCLAPHRRPDAALSIAPALA